VYNAPPGGIEHIARSRLKLVRLLGEGEFGSVYLGVCEQFPQPGDVTTVAVKAPKLLATSGPAAYDENLRDFEREAELLDELRHDNIISLYGISIDEVPLLVLEYMENGDLNKFLRSGETLILVQLIKLGGHPYKLFKTHCGGVRSRFFCRESCKIWNYLPSTVNFPLSGIKSSI